MTEAVQTFRKNGHIVCIKCGLVAVNIPSIMKARKAERVGFSTRYFGETPVSYHDIAIDGRVILHIIRKNFDGCFPIGATMFFWEDYPC